MSYYAKAIFLVSAVVLCFKAQSATLDNATLESAKAFLKNHLEYYNTANSEFLKHYNVDAEINLTVIKPQDQPKQTALRGSTWTRLVREAWGAKNSPNETIELHNVNITGNGQGLEVVAQRFSKSRCYWDNDYTMTLQKDGLGQYKITRETILINHNNLCPPPSLEEYLINQNIQVVPQ